MALIATGDDESGETKSEYYTSTCIEGYLPESLSTNLQGEQRGHGSPYRKGCPVVRGALEDFHSRKQKTLGGRAVSSLSAFTLDENLSSSGLSLFLP